MFRHHWKVAYRNMLRNKVHSFINIIGLSVGMAVALIIGLWIYDEFSFNHFTPHHNRIARVMFTCNYNNERIAAGYLPYPTGEELRTNYRKNFNRVVMSTFTNEHLLTAGDRKFRKTGNFMEPGASEMFSLRMLKGAGDNLEDPSTMLVSESLAKALFGSSEPLGQVLKVDNMNDVKITGVYKDFPYNSDFKDVSFIGSWELFHLMNPKSKSASKPWASYKFQCFVELPENTAPATASAAIKNIMMRKLPVEDTKVLQPAMFLYPMERWHLYEAYNEGGKIAEKIETVWLFGFIGLFVLLLACINFMNLSTAQSEKRAREVGIRKTIGSQRGQLIGQFFGESLLAAFLAFLLSILWVILILPFFNQIADKKIFIPWDNPWFWLCSIGFSILTGLVAGLYPALYLSSFQPVKVIKGTFMPGRAAMLPRKILVVLQFTVSVALIIGTIVIYRQVQFTRNRPIGYNRDGLIMVNINPDIEKHFAAIRHELKSAGLAVEMGASVNTTTEFNIGFVNFNWEGKDPSLSAGFAVSNVTHEYGKTIGWQIRNGRDFSRDFPTDSLAFVINEAAAQLLNFKEPVGATVLWDGKPFRIIGVIKNIIFESPYQPVTPSIFHMAGPRNLVATIKMNPQLSTSQALAGIGSIFNKYNPDYPFDYRFVDLEYEKKFRNEERAGKLAGYFSALAIFISCLGLFGMTSFMVERRMKEIGVRKVLGASVFNLWRHLSKDFIILVVIALCIAIPLAWFFMSDWLENYHYRSTISAWIFVAVGAGSIMISLLTVSFQTIRAALKNPVNSLQAE
jgi:putative ABC transport system permease protein